MIGPGDWTAGADGRGRLRASHADREQAVDALKAAFVQGRLTKDELDLRAGQAFASRTYAELAAITADLPAGQATAQPPAPAGAPDKQPVLRPGPVAVAATVAYGGVWAFVVFMSTHSAEAPWAPPLIFGGFSFYLFILIMCVVQMAALRREKHSGGQPPRRPAAGAGGQSARHRDQAVTRSRSRAVHRVPRSWRSEAAIAGH